MRMRAYLDDGGRGGRAGEGANFGSGVWWGGVGVVVSGNFLNVFTIWWYFTQFKKYKHIKVLFYFLIFNCKMKVRVW